MVCEFGRPRDWLACQSTPMCSPLSKMTCPCSSRKASCGVRRCNGVEAYLGQPLIRIKIDRSNVSTSSAKSERVKLPCDRNTVTDILLFSSVGAYWTSDTDVEFEVNTLYEIEFMVLDLSGAFWNVPLHPEERRYFVFKCRSQRYVVLRTAQGSRHALLA